MIDLTILRSHLTGLGTPLILLASDAPLPQALRDLLGSMPAASLSLTSLPDGITIDAGRLTVSGPARGDWPVEGFPGLTVSLTTAVLVIRGDDTAPIATAQVTGTLALGRERVAVRLVPDLLGKAAGWRLTLTGAVAAMSATDLLLLGLDDPGLGDSGLSLLDSAVVFDPARFALTFFPGTGVSPSYTFTLTVAGARWAPLPSLPSVDAVDIVAYVLPGAYTVELVAELSIDGVRVDVGVSVGPRPQWTVFIRPPEGGSLPGLAALVGLLSGADEGLAEQTRTSLGTVSDDSSGFDAAITAVTAGLSWKAPSLDYVEIDSVLTLRGLKLAVSLLLPDITLRGSLYQGQAAYVAAVLASFGLPTDRVPAKLAVTAVDFSAQPGSSVYRLAMTVDELWDVGPLTLQEVAFSVAYSPFDQFTVSVAGILGLGERTRVRVSGGHSAQTGWSFSGVTDQGALLDIGDVLAKLAGTFGIDTVPGALRTLTLTEVSASFVSVTGAFSLTCAGYLEIGGTVLTLRVSADVTRGSTGREDPSAVTGSKGYTARFHGLLTYGDLDFDVLFDLAGPGAETFVATYSHSGDAARVDLRDLIAELSADAAAEVPAGLSVGLTDVKFVRTKPSATAPATFVLGLDLSAAVSLTGLPVVGPHLPPDTTLAVENLQILYASTPLPADTTARVNALLGSKIVPLPTAGLAGGAALLVQVALGATRQTISLGVAPASTPTTPSLTANATAPATAAATVAAPSAAVATADGAHWVEVGRAFGPARIERVGLAYRQGEEAKVALLLDGSISVAGVTLSLAGLAVGVSMSNPLAVPSFELSGLGLAYVSGPLRIGGAFLKGQITYENQKYTAYSGSAQVRTEQFGLAAIGSYARLPEGPSLFVYAVLDAALGGPPVFFVRGLAAGFGYNRRLVPPAIADVASFPLVAQAVGGTQPGTPLADALATLASYLPPSPGDRFLAIGVRFTSFEMIDSFVLLVVGFGHRFELDVLGLSTLILPAADAAQAGMTPIAEVQLALRATLVPAEGRLQVTAQLTPNSFLLSRACHLTGGFAFSTWWGEENHGDFVLTVGGYHPHFRVPSHYPVVPRLGFSWQVSPQLALTGGAYFALTPGALMAGGNVSATWKDSALAAWFDASFDFLIAWQPYHYEANLHVSVRASYTFSDFGNSTISAHVGADVRLWGPEFAGTATIDLDVTSVTVSFGAGEKGALRAVPWSRFRKAMLPDTITTVALSGGTTPDGGTGLGAVDPAKLELVTDSLVPSTAAYRPGQDGQVELPSGSATTHFGIGPLGAAPGLVRTEHHITIVRKVSRGDGTFDLVAAGDRFHYEPVLKNLPFALWGTKLTPALSDPRLISQLLTGYTIRPVPPDEPAAPPWVTRSALQDATPLTAGDVFQPAVPPSFTADDGGPEHWEEEIVRGLTDPTVADARAAVVHAVLSGSDIDLNGADATGFHATPQVGSYA